MMIQKIKQNKEKYSNNQNDILDSKYKTSTCVNCLTYPISNYNIKLCQYCIESKCGCPFCSRCDKRISWKLYHLYLTKWKITSIGKEKKYITKLLCYDCLKFDY